MELELEHDSKHESLFVQEPAAAEAGSTAGLQGSRDLLEGRISVLENAVYRLRLVVYFVGVLLLIAGVLAQWLFKQMVRRIDELSGSVQIHVDQRARGMRLNFEGQLTDLRSEVRGFRGNRASPATSDLGPDGSATERTAPASNSHSLTLA